MTLVNKTPDYVELYLATVYTDGDTTLDCYAKNDTYKLTDQKTSSLITSFRCVGINRDDQDSFMGMAVSLVVTNGTFGGATRYTLTLRTSDGANPMVGLANSDDGTTADDNIISGNKLSTLPADSLIMVAVGSATFTELYDSLTSISATATGEAGEAISARESLSIHTDGKLYLYNATNYPNLSGIADADYALAATATYYRNGGTSTGHTGLTVGSIYYGENTGAITATSSGTTKSLGQATSATAIFVNPQIMPGVSQASAAESKAGTASGVYLAPASMEDSRPWFKEEFSCDMSHLTRIAAGGTGAESIGDTGVRLGCTTGLYSYFMFDTINMGGDSFGIITGRKIFKFVTNVTGAFGVDDQEAYVGVWETSPTTTTLASVDTGFAGFQIKRESGTVNIYALTKEENAKMTRTLVNTVLADGDIFIIDFTTGTDVKYYMRRGGATTLEATHDTVANIPLKARAFGGWVFNGAGSGTPAMNVSYVKAWGIS